MKKYMYLIVIMSILSCQMEQKQGLDNSESIASNTNISLKSSNKSNDQKTESKKIIKTASIRLEVGDVLEAINDITAMVLIHDGYISDQNLTNVEDKQHADVVIKIPSDSLDIFVNKCNDIALNVDYVNIISKDISEEYLDLLTRLKTKKEVHRRYIEIIRSKAGTIEELLAAERKIGVLQEEIEASQGKIRYYDNRVKMSTLSIELYKKEVISAKVESRLIPFWNNAENGFIGGWNMIVQLIIALISIWPLVLIGLILYYQRKKLGLRWIK